MLRGGNQSVFRFYIVGELEKRLMSTKSNSTVGGNTDLNEEFNLIDVFFLFVLVMNLLYKGKCVSIQSYLFLW